MEYIIGIIVGISVIIIWQTITFFLRKSFKTGTEQGANQITIHIYNHIKKTGEINLIVDGVTMTLVEKKVEIKKSKK